MTTQESSELDQHTFFAGLMLALRLRRDQFTAEGQPFHRAFLAVVDRAQEDQGVQLRGARWIQMDPVFGVVPEANEMLLEAEHDRVLAFMNPRLKIARFTIEKAEADRELKQLAPEATEWFMRLGAFFDEQLETATA